MLRVISKLSPLISNVRNFATKPSHILSFSGTMSAKKIGDGATKPKTKLKKETKPPTKKLVATPATKSKIQPVTNKSRGGRGGSVGGGKKCGGTGDGGAKKPPSKPKKSGGSFIVDKCYIYDRPKANSRPFRNISYCILPLIVGFSGYVLTQHEERELHFVPFEYMYKRLKRFAWGDGRTTLFHGRNNFIPEEEQYDKVPNRWDKDLQKRKSLREQHAKEELERRKLRHATKVMEKIKADKSKEDGGEGHNEVEDNRPKVDTEKAQEGSVKSE